MRKYLFTCLLIFVWAAAARAQAQSPAAPADTTRGKPVAPNQGGAAAATASETPSGDDLELETIEIQAVIEKPNVDIIPKRTKPEWEETRFIERSFETELKQAPKGLMLVDDELDRAQKLDTLKKNEPPKK